MGAPSVSDQGPSESVESADHPVLFHTHGIGEVDFSSMSPGSLHEINDLAAARAAYLVPTIFMRRQYSSQFRQVLIEYATGRTEGMYDRILGFGIEGPLLGSSGGVPQAGCWTPSSAEWVELAELGPLGLSYIVMAPDAMELTDELQPGVLFRDVIDAFYLNGVKLALGHFRHDDPELSACRTERVIDYIQARYGPSPSIVITDHLYNDMPRQFTHAWRTPAERARRDAELKEFFAGDWTISSLSGLLGPVPAALLRAAAEGRLTPTLNFDGEHVDLEICRRTVEFLGCDRLIAITDDTESAEMAGESLSRHQGSTLLFRDDGKVAAGSSGIVVQAENMRSIGIADADLANLLGKVARSVLDARARMPRAISDVAVDPGRYADPATNHAALVERYLAQLKQAATAVDSHSLGRLIGTVVDAIRSEQTVFIAGNGGSAATAAHMVSDWSRAAARSGIKPARVSGLTDNLASVTGLANDVGFPQALAQRLLESGQPGDLLVILSVSGASPNLINLAEAAREAGLDIAALLGRPGPVTRLADPWAAIGASDYGLAEDLQIAVNHMVVRALSGEMLPGVCGDSRQWPAADPASFSEAAA
jgi:phosphoheptose isomerase/N-acetylglucosamine-6-phosphate deacetylase